MDTRYKIFHTAQELDSYWERIKNNGSYPHPEEHIIPLKNLESYLAQ